MWSDLPQPEYMRRAGKGARRCTSKVNLVGALHVGKLFAYDAPVLDADASPEAVGVPPLYGPTQLANDIALCCSNTGRVYRLPEPFCVDEVVWPQGTSTLECEQAHGGHWLLEVAHWDAVPACLLERVRVIRSKEVATA